MPLLVVGTVALDTVETPTSSRADFLGGSAVHFSFAASFFTSARLVSVVGEDWPAEHTKLLHARGIDTSGLAVVPGGKSFRWTGRYHENMNDRDTLATHLNVYEDFDPTLPDEYRHAKYVFLANGSPQSQIERMSQQISYQLQRASLRKSGLVRHQVQLAPLLDTLCDALDKVYREKRVRVERDFDKILMIPMEQGALLELLGNLLENAFRLCLGEIRVSAQVRDGYCELKVEDDGPGVPEDQRERILKRGERLDAQHPGQGIGTAVVKDIIESYDGELFLEASPLGGAEFRIRFPLI